jgi:hypothetical protein
MMHRYDATGNRENNLEPKSSNNIGQSFNDEPDNFCRTAISSANRRYPAMQVEIPDYYIKRS